MTLLALLLGLVACTDGPRSLDNPDQIPSHLLRGEILGMDMRAGGMWSRENPTDYTLYVYDETTPWEDTCATGLPRLGLYFRTELEPETTRIHSSTGSFFHHTDDVHEIIDASEGWLVVEEASPGWVSGRISMITYDDDGQTLAWAEGAFEGDTCQ